jgi:glyceraldehyde-3-phosphate dehydrogenase (NAD(P))
MATVVHIVGTGTIGEPLIGLFADLGSRMGVDEVTFHKRTPLVSDRAKLNHLMARGARLAVDEAVRGDFEQLGHEISFDADEALARASVVIDCTPAGNRNKELKYERIQGPAGYLAQGSEFGFGKPYARGINEDVLDADEDRYIQVVSCNTHNMVTLVKTLCGNDDGGLDHARSNFVCIRRSNDISQADKFVPSPNVGKHDDEEFGTHHARDAHNVFRTLGEDLDLFSSALKVNTQYMHSIWFSITVSRDITLEEVIERLAANPRVAMTEKRDANLIFSFGRDHGYYGRILSQTVVVVPTLTVRRKREIYGFCFTPQDGNSLMSSIAGALWRVDPDWQTVSERIEPLRRWLYREI